MDGVPVKISERYKPPRKIALPPGYQQRLAAETTVDNYDFKLERSVLEKMGEWRRVRQAAQDSLNERIESSKLAEESVQVMTQSSSSTNHTPDPVSPNPCAVIIPNKSVVTQSIPTPMSVSNFHSHNDSILLPMQFAQPKFEVQTSKASHFNISDFEADTSSPFDNMELKTINEMEELAHVLQPLNNSPDANKNISCYSANTFHASDIENSFVVKCDPKRSRGDILPSYHSLSPPVQNNYTQLNQPTYGLLANNVYDYVPQRAWAECHAAKRRSESQPVPTSALGTLSLRAAPAELEGGGRDGWKSVPDIVQELEREVQDSADRRATVRPSSYGSSAIQDWPSWPSADSLPSAAIESPVARQAVAMGFDVGRAQRAVDALGPDQKKVVDYLLQVASLESLYPTRNVERALLANGLDRSRAVDHLEATNQLLDLGFREEDIFDALVRFQNDRDKALDHLIT